MQFSITGQERVNKKLSIALNCINQLKLLKDSRPTQSKAKRMESNRNRIQKKKKELVFLSIRAKDKVTRFYASNALKEIAQKLKELSA